MPKKKTEQFLFQVCDYNNCFSILLVLLHKPTDTSCSCFPTIHSPLHYFRYV